MKTQTEIPLVTAAARAHRGYNVILGLVLRGEIEGRQDVRGRWMVRVESLDTWCGRHEREASPKPARMDP
jgi:hypothetical protein